MKTETKTYWVIEIANEKGTPMYWTGFIPFDGITQEEKPMYTKDIHQAEKMDTKPYAEYCQGEYQIQGRVMEHMDVAPPSPQQTNSEKQ